MKRLGIISIIFAITVFAFLGFSPYCLAPGGGEGGGNGGGGGSTPSSNIESELNQPLANIQASEIIQIIQSPEIIDLSNDFFTAEPPKEATYIWNPATETFEKPQEGKDVGKALDVAFGAGAAGTAGAAGSGASVGGAENIPQPPPVTSGTPEITDDLGSSQVTRDAYNRTVGNPAWRASKSTEEIEQLLAEYRKRLADLESIRAKHFSGPEGALRYGAEANRRDLLLYYRLIQILKGEIEARKGHQDIGLRGETGSLASGAGGAGAAAGGEYVWDPRTETFVKATEMYEAASATGAAATQTKKTKEATAPSSNTLRQAMQFASLTLSSFIGPGIMAVPVGTGTSDIPKVSEEDEKKLEELQKAWKDWADKYKSAAESRDPKAIRDSLKQMNRLSWAMYRIVAPYHGLPEIPSDREIEKQLEEEGHWLYKEEA